MRIAFHVPCAEYLERAPGGEKHPSGDGMIIANLIEALRKRGHQVKIVSRLDVRDFWRGRIPARRLIAEAVVVRGDMKRFSPDAWLIHYPRVKCPDLFGWWQRPKRYVILKGGAEGGRLDLSAMSWVWRKLLEFANRHTLKRADAIEVIRLKSQRDLCALGIPEDRVHFLPRAIKMWSHLPSREEARRVLGLPQESPIVLCVSRLAVRRGSDDPRPAKTESVLDLLRAFPSLPSESRLLLIGDGPGREEVEAEAARLHVAERVLFIGRVDHSDISWYYAACDFFAFPEREEGNRAYQSLLEAQACGRPVVTLRNELSELTTEDGRTGLLARDLDEFRDHMLALSLDRNRCDRLGKAAAEFVERCFSIDVRAKQIEDLLLGRPVVTTMPAVQRVLTQEEGVVPRAA